MKEENITGSWTANILILSNISAPLPLIPGNDRMLEYSIHDGAALSGFLYSSSINCRCPPSLMPPFCGAQAEGVSFEETEEIDSKGIA
jgi:hypothetical protein